MRRVILVRYGEIALKGKNRSFFEGKLLSHIKRSLQNLPVDSIERAYGRIFIRLKEDGRPADPFRAGSSEAAASGIDRSRMEEYLRQLRKVFGVVSVSPALEVPLELDALRRAAELQLAETLESREQLQEAFSNQRLRADRPVTIAVATRRANKSFPLTSPEVNRMIGTSLLSGRPSLRVNLDSPDITINVELREKGYVFSRIIPGPGGLPLGSSGRGMLLLSGGIDSPVAGWLAMKRGVAINAVHFYSYPFTSERSREKVLDLCRVLAQYAGEVRLHVVLFTEIQRALRERCPEAFLTLLMRRMMMRLAEAIARKAGALALVTGESLGQVASQTLESLDVTGEVVDMPILRPLIAWDKEEIIDLAREIGTFDISIRPYEDCCALFVPPNPKTRPGREEIARAEARLGDFNPLLDSALGQTEVLLLS